MPTFKAHIFKKRSSGSREEVKIKLFTEDDEPIDLEVGGGPAWGPFVVCDSVVAQVVPTDSAAAPWNWGIFNLTESGHGRWPIVFESPEDGIPVWVSVSAVCLSNTELGQWWGYTSGEVVLEPGATIPATEIQSESGVPVGVSLVEQEGGGLAVDIEGPGMFLVGLSAQVAS